MANFYYYDNNGRKIGPINNAQLKALAVQGVIVPDTQLETDTGHTGKAGQIKGLFAAVSAPVPVPARANSGQQPHCTNCGAVVSLNAAACLSCGVRPQGHRKFCAACGVSLNPEQVICVKCGVAVGGVAAVPQTGYQNNAQIDYRVNVPNRNEAAEKIKSSYSGFFVSSIILLILIPVAILFMYFSDSVGVVGVGIVIVALFTVAIAVAVYMYILLYLLWKVVPKDIAAATPGSFVSVTPGIAVGFCLIPFFNFYWQYVAFWGLGKNLNKLLAAQGKSYRVNERTGLMFCSLSCASIIVQGVATVAFVVLLFYLNSLKNGAVALLEGKA
jgi:hypothetical protein